MSLLARLSILLAITILMTGCTADRTVDPPLDASATATTTFTADTDLTAREIIAASAWEIAADFDTADKVRPADGDRGVPRMLDVSRELVVDDIYHYHWNVRVGSGPFDVVVLHRVVRERAPHRPIRSRKSVFMLHGDFKTFPGCFMPGSLSDSYPDDFGIAVHMAQGGLDVWGMDQAHNSIPAEATDFSSMADWNMDKYVRDTRLGLGVARLVRLFTGNGLRKMNLLGFSGGAALAFAVANEEAGLPRGWRHVGGLIPVDQGVATTDADFAASDCATSEYYAGLIADGEYAEANPFPMFGIPARDDPDGPSELIPDFSNLEAALAIAVYEYVEGFPYHFLAGDFTADGLPDGLQYTNVGLWIDFLIQAPPYFANVFSSEELAPGCGLDATPWLNQIGDVDLPVLYVSSAGGFGLVYEATLDLMTSADTAMLTISLHPPEEVALDFAHIDLFTADNAPQLVWQPILDWIGGGRAAADQGEEPSALADAF